MTKIILIALTLLGITWAVMHQPISAQPVKQPTQWEYKVIELKFDEVLDIAPGDATRDMNRPEKWVGVLNKLGAEGWEIAGEVVDPTMHVTYHVVRVTLKRAKQ